MRWLQILDGLEKIFTILAIIAGGLWAYYHYRKDRVHKIKFEHNISGKVIFSDKVEYLVIEICLKNLGLSKIDIKHEGSALRVFACEEKEAIPHVQDVEWQRIRTLKVFEKHQWIESGETIQEQRLIVVPKKNYFAYRAHLRITAKNTQRDVFKVIERPITKEALKKLSNQSKREEESDA
jgi:hypothetical protein